MVMKKSQMWSLDLIIASMIFLIGILIFLVYSTNYSGEAEETFKKLSYDGEFILKNILSEGYPKNWDNETVVKIGIFSNDKINESKLEKFYNLTIEDYNKTKKLFNTKYDYYFFMDEKIIINSTEVDGIGKPGITRYNIIADNLIKITRFTIYKDKPVTIYLYIWE